MAIIALPTNAEFDRLDWNSDAKVQVNRGSYVRSRRVLDFDNVIMVCSVEIMVSTALEDRAWRLFHSQLRGAANTFRLPVTECAQTVITGTAIQAAANTAAGSTTLSTKNWANASVLLVAGQYVTVNDQPVMLTADVPASGTNRTLTFDRPLRQAVTTNTTVIADRPTGLMFIPGGEKPQTSDGVMVWAFEAEEAF